MRSHALLVTALITASSATAQVDFLHSVSAADGTLRNISIVYASTVASTPIVSSANVPATQAHGLARHAPSGTAYSFVRFTGSSVQQFCALDLVTGVATIIAPVTGTFVGLTARADGTLFAVRDAVGTVPASLHTIDRTTGVVTFVMSLPTGTAGEGIVFAPDQSLYRVSGRGAPNVEEVFERLNPGTGGVTSITLTGEDSDGLTVLASYTGSLLMGVDHQGDLYALTTAGHVRRFGTLDHGEVSGLLFVEADAASPFFRGYGDGCAGTSGAYPMLLGCGHASGGHNPGAHLRFTPPSAIGVLAAGSDDTSAPFPSATCAAQIVPIFLTIGFVANSQGDFNTWFPIPPGTPPLDIFFQVAVLDGGALVVSNALRMHVV